MSNLFYNALRVSILCIRNKAADFGGELIFGHGAEEQQNPKLEDFDENGESNRTPLKDAEDSARNTFYEFKKDTESVIEDNLNFWSELSNVNKVIVLGHSLAKVDWPCFNLLNELLPKVSWKISYFDDKKDLMKIEDLNWNILKRKSEKIKRFKLAEIAE